MKSLLPLIFSLFYFIPFGNAFDALVDFQVMDYARALEKAAGENKLVFVNYNKNGIDPCEIMKATTFKDPNVVDFLNDVFINVDANIENGAGMAWKKKFNIECLPTYMVFDHTGKLEGLTQGRLNANDFLFWLNSLSLVKSKVKDNLKKQEKVIQTQFVSLEQDDFNAPQEAKTSDIKNKKADISNSTSFSPSKNEADEVIFDRVPIPSNQEARKKKKSPTLFSIQLGAFRKYSNAQASLSKTKSKIPGNYYIIEEPGKNKNKLFKVLQGSYSSQQEAEDSLMRFAKKDIAGFLRRL